MARVPITVDASYALPLTRKISLVLMLLLLACLCVPAAAETALPKNQSLFLVATEQLEGTSFQEAVILVTHYSKRGATGLTINRPTTIPLKNLFPRVEQFTQDNESLYLGGPVNTNAIFVLLRTDNPGEKMHQIAKDIYFSTAKNAFTESLVGKSRTYAGYAGWKAGQLQAEISRGDWLLVHTEPDIIFEESINKLWHRLSKRWSGHWL